MKKPILLLLLLPLLLLTFPFASLAAVDIGAGFAIVSFEDDLDGVDTDSGTAFELTVGEGSMRFMLAMQSSSHDLGDYEAIMGGLSFGFDLESFKPRIYALIGNHEFESTDGWGVTLGGGAVWPLSRAVGLGFDIRVSQWEGDGGADIGTGTLQLLLQVGF